MAEVVLLNQDGQLVKVDESLAASKVASGLYEEAPRDVVVAAENRAAAREAAARKAEELESAGAIANTVVQSAGEAIFAPLDWAGNKLGLLEPGRRIRNIGQTDAEAAWTNRRIAEMQQANPGAQFAGETIGQTAAALATGLGSGAAKLGALATKSAIGRTAIAAGIEGGTLGAAQAMQDPQADAEHILFAGGMGAILGAGGGAALHGLGRVFGSARDELGAKAFANAQASLERDAALSQGERGLAALDARMAKASGAPEELVEKFGSRNLAQREAAIKADQHFDEFTTKTAFEMRDISRKLTDAVDSVTEQVRASAIKQEGISKLLGDLENSTQINRTAYGVVTGAVDAYREAIGSFAPDYLPASIQRQLGNVDRHVMSTLEALGSADTVSAKYMLANGLKQTLDDTTKKLRIASQNKNLFNAFDQQALNDVATKINDVSDTVRKTLENGSIWGEKVAKAQREVNAIWHEGAVDALNEFGRTFERDTGRVDFHTGRRIYESDPTKFEQVLRTFGTTAGDQPQRALENYLHHVGKIIDKIDSVYQLGEGTHNAASVARELFSQLESKYQEAAKTAKLVADWRKLATYDRSGDKTLFGAVARSVPVVGPLAERTASVFTNPASDIATNALRATSGIKTGSLGAAYDKVRRVTSDVASWVRRGAESPVVRHGTMSAAITAFRGGQKDNPKQSADRVRMVLNADPSKIGEYAPDLDPATSMSAGTVAGNAIAYLQSKLPAYAQSPSLVRSGRAAVMNKPDELAFARVWGTIADPSTVAKDLKTGRLMPEQVDALRTVYPQIYESLKLSTLEALSEADARGNAVSIQSRQQIATLLDLPEIADTALSGDTAERIGMLVAKQSQQQKQQQQSQSVASHRAIISSARTPFEESQV